MNKTIKERVITHLNKKLRIVETTETKENGSSKRCTIVKSELE